MSDERKVKIKKVTVRHPTVRELKEKNIPLEESLNAEHQIVDVEFEKGKMSDERKEWLLKHVDYVFNECRICAEHHNYNCPECPKGGEACDEARMELRRLIQQKPEIDGEKIAMEIYDTFHDSHTLLGAKLKWLREYIDKIISDVKGGGNHEKPKR